MIPALFDKIVSAPYIILTLRPPWSNAGSVVVKSLKQLPSVQIDHGASYVMAIGDFCFQGEHEIVTDDVVPWMRVSMMVGIVLSG